MQAIDTYKQYRKKEFEVLSLGSSSNIFIFDVNLRAKLIGLPNNQIGLTSTEGNLWHSV